MVEVDRDRLIIQRRWKYAPPPWVMYEALVDERHRWLQVLREETVPGVDQARRPDLVVFSPWLTPIVELLVVEIAPCDAGSVMTVLAYGDPDTPRDVRRDTRYRIGEVFGSAVRYWVDEPHW